MITFLFFLVVAVLFAALLVLAAGVSYRARHIRPPAAALVLFVLFAAFCSIPSTQAADTELGLEPYGLVSWDGINGSPDLGAGAALTLGINKNFSIVTFGEGDSTRDAGIIDQVDRFGAGARYTARFGTRLSLDAGVAGAYDLERETFFLRLPLGANFTAYHSAKLDAGLRVQYAFDISGKGHHGTSTGRLFAGPVVNFRF